MEGSLDKLVAGYRSTWYGKIDWWWVGKKVDIATIHYSLRSIIFDTKIDSIKRKECLKFIFKIIFNRWD